MLVYLWDGSVQTIVWDRSCKSNFPSHPVYWHQANSFQRWPYTARCLARQPLECQILSHWYDSTGKIPAQAGIEPRVCRSLDGRLNHLANEGVRGLWKKKNTGGWPGKAERLRKQRITERIKAQTEMNREEVPWVNLLRFQGRMWTCLIKLMSATDNDNTKTTHSYPCTNIQLSGQEALNRHTVHNHKTASLA